MSSSINAGGSTSNHVYIHSKEYSWVPARLLESDGIKATVSIPSYNNETQIGLTTRDQRIVLHRSHKEEIICLSDYPANALPLQNVDENGQLKTVQDLIHLDFLHEPAILYNLKVRHILQKKPYTRTGDIIIAVNPYQWYSDLYSEAVRANYAEAIVWNRHHDPLAQTDLDPHVYETSSLAYRGLAVEGEDQSILVSGESGAGKTETVKILLHDIASVQRGNGGGISAITNTDGEYHNPIVQRVLDSNPLLEAFGNAKTIRNDNSSRFGKFISLQFHNEDPFKAAYRGKAMPSCVLAGSKCEVYLLEKNRVVSHESEERTFHIFYQLLASEEKTLFWPGLSGCDHESFRYVGYTDTEEIEGTLDRDRFTQTLASLKLVGVVDDKLLSLMQAICVVLQLGNVLFGVDENDETRSVIYSDNLAALCELMGISEDILVPALTIRTVKARQEEFKVPLSADTAKESCDAFAKEIYNSTFLWLVRSINDATAAEYNYDGDISDLKKFGTIGLLDIFGFESFETNRFEQLCINYANEKLQQKFTQDVFRSVQAEYEYEGIALGEITYDDNSDVLDLIESRMGLVAFLNEECVRPGGSDKGFVSKAAAMNKDNSCFILEKAFRDIEFGIQHYAGQVVYDATGFVTKNMDTLPSDLQECATKSSNPIVAKELGNDAMMNEVVSHHKKHHRVAAKASTLGKRSGNFSSVFSKFRGQLTALMTNLKVTRSRYIRCIKPNVMKKPLLMQHQSTIEQLRCAGVVAAVTISRSAFPNRLEQSIVLDRFKAIWGKGQHIAAEDSTEGDGLEKMKFIVDKMLTVALKTMESTRDNGKTVLKAFVMGKTKTYFRVGALEYLENERVRCLSRWAVEIQRIIRQYIVHSRYIRYRDCTITLESVLRMLLARRRYVQQRSAAVIMQCFYRCIAGRVFMISLRRHYKATLLQKHWRMTVAIVQFRSSQAAVVNIQRIARGALQRPKYVTALIERKEEAKLENQVIALQRKLEQAENRRIEAEQRAEERSRAIVESHHDGRNKSPEEKKEDKEAQSTSSSVTHSLANSLTIAEPTAGQLSAQQQTLMDESGKMLEYLRKEVFKLRSHNAKMREDFELVKDNNQRLMDANASAGASFAALNQHAKQLSRANEKLQADCQNYKQHVQKLSVTQAELKEELKMKQATYVAEVHSRLQYQKALSKIIDVAQEKCRDDRLVEEFLRIADACEAEYMSGPTGMSSVRSPLSPFTVNPRKLGSTDNNDSGLMSSIRNLWS